MKHTNKVREMAGVTPGRGSAGRANAALRPKPLATGESMSDFRRACDRMLAEHVPGYQVFNFSGQDITSEMLAAAPPKHRGPREMNAIYWKSKPRAVVWK